MSQREKIQLDRGSGNLFRDFGGADADVHQAKAKLAARIIGVLEEQALSVRQQSRTGFAASDLSCIRNADLGRFRIDRLIRILGALGQSVEVHFEISCPAGQWAPQRRGTAPPFHQAAGDDDEG